MDLTSSSLTEQRQALDELRQAANRAERLFEINVRLSAMRNPDALLRFIIETAADVLGCEAASILLFDEAAQQLRFAAATGSNAEELARIPVPLDDSLAGLIFTEDRPLLIGDVAEESRHYEPVGQEVAFDARSLVGVPMRLDDDPIGVLEGLNKTDGPFTDDDAEVLAVIAAQAAVAIRNARQIRALERANEQLSRLDRLKSDFLALASHELRTPLSAILGYGGILEEEIPEALMSFLTPILDAADRMHEVVEAMSQMDTLRSGTAQLSRRSVSLQSALEAARTAIAKQVEVAPIRFDLPGDPLTLQADPDHLRLIFAHLLKNAVQFSPDGGPITVQAVPEGGALHVTVRDKGTGLAEKELDRIFEEFYQVEDHLTRLHGGLGLGLTMTREMVRLHGGRIYAESDGLDAGTTMHVHLPITAPSPLSAFMDRPPAAAPSPRGLAR